MKICTKCKLEKDECEFGKDNRSKDKLRSDCKSCVNERAAKQRAENPEYSIQYRINNREYYKEKSKEYNKNNIEELKEKHKKYYEENKNKPEVILKKKEQQAKIYIKNRDIRIEYAAKWRAENPELNKERDSIYYYENREEVIRKNGEYAKRRKKIDPLYKLIINIRTLIGNVIRRGYYTKNQHTHEYLDCTYEEFKLHIESQFTEGMTWDNYGEWHLDHIYPVSRAVDEEHLIQLNHYTNFQPLWAADNIRKGNKLPEEWLDNQQNISYNITQELTNEDSINESK